MMLMFTKWDSGQTYDQDDYILRISYATLSISSQVAQEAIVGNDLENLIMFENH